VQWNVKGKPALDCLIPLVYDVYQTMFSSEMRNLLFQVISSWQVLAVTGVLIIYIFMVNSVARIYRRRRPPPIIMPRIKKPKQEKNQEKAPAAASESGDIELEEEDIEK